MRPKIQKLEVIRLYQSGMSVPNIFECTGVPQMTIFRWTKYLLEENRKQLTLSKINSRVAEEWHPTKNGELTPNDVTWGTNRKVWWKCSKKGHEWKTKINQRTKKEHATNCPYCATQMVCKDNCLSIVNPQLAKEWHLTKNGELTPDDVLPGTSKTVWWKCSKKGHEWRAGIYSRNWGNGCPYCSGRKVCEDNCLATLNPVLANEWDSAKNGDLTPSDVTVSSSKKIWWNCSKRHCWKVAVSTRSAGIGCPYCNGKRVCEDNCLATRNPQLAKEWHPTRNQLTPSDVTASSGKKVWWKCLKGQHEWDSTIGNRAKGKGCPNCIIFQKEIACRNIFEGIFNKEFPRNRKVLECRLELDGYCDELKLAFEYNGQQHYKRIPYWHKTQENFENAQARDRLKAQLCKEKGITLIVIPYTENHRLEEFIIEQID